VVAEIGLTVKETAQVLRPTEAELRALVRNGRLAHVLISNRIPQNASPKSSRGCDQMGPWPHLLSL
jgi:hypothetical protein